MSTIQIETVTSLDATDCFTAIFEKPNSEPVIREFVFESQTGQLCQFLTDKALLISGTFDGQPVVVQTNQLFYDGGNRSFCVLDQAMRFIEIARIEDDFFVPVETDGLIF